MNFPITYREKLVYFNECDENKEIEWNTEFNSQNAPCDLILITDFAALIPKIAK